MTFYHFRYCTISINSVGPVTCDMPTEILISVHSRSSRDFAFFSVGQEMLSTLYHLQNLRQCYGEVLDNSIVCMKVWLYFYVSR